MRCFRENSELCRSARHVFAFMPGAAAAAFAVMSAIPGPVLAAGPAAATDSVAFQAIAHPTLAIHRAAGDITIDGNLDDPGWRDAARTSAFSEYFPNDRTRPPEATEALVTYDSRNLYLAFICADDHPEKIRGMLRDRDNIFSDDFIGVMLDTFGDNRFVYEIYANPLGCQGDLRMTNGGDNEDSSFDLVFQSAGRITAAGYQIEMAIPFASLRFPRRPEQTWRMNFWRTWPREARCEFTWAALSRDVPCFTCQFGTLTGIRDVSPGGRLELLPAVVGTQASALNDPGDLASGWNDRSPNGEASLTGRFALTSNATAEATVNPDFSQVESDPGQIDVNTTYALFLNERRPFFQEGSDLFNSLIDAVYTRSINDPDVAGKVTGQAGKTSVAYLVARDHRSPYILPFPEHSDTFLGGRSTSNIIRLRQSLHDESNIGFLATDRRADDGGSGTLGGVDGNLRFARNYSVLGQFLFSRTHEANDPGAYTPDSSESPTFDGGRHTVVFDGETYGGHAGVLSVQRNARRWNMNLQWQEYSPTFRAEDGFVTRNDTRTLDYWTGWNARPRSRWVNRIEPNVEIARLWNFAGLRNDEWLIPELDGQFRWQTSAGVNYLWSMERFHGIDFRGIRRAYGYLNSDFSRFMSVGANATVGRSIARNVSPPVLGYGTSVELFATLKPWGSFQIQPDWSYAEMHHPDTGARIFNGYILRTEFDFQCTREISARVVTQYDDFARQFTVEPLATYRVNPFTVFYAGSNLAMMDSAGTLDRVSRQFFAKFQYLFRL